MNKEYGYTRDINFYNHHTRNDLIAEINMYRDQLEAKTEENRILNLKNELEAAKAHVRQLEAEIGSVF